ncbi:MAG: AraC family transcriptional regulator [Pseudomonas sp.]|uniref:AraC family transcriptional regulator n=1 Tax=Pseudomonas sp. TaxID=306 RepID=UPI00339A9BE7
MLDPRTVANTYVRTLLGAVQKQGVPSAQLLQGLPVDEALLGAPNGRIGVALVQRIWQRALALSGDPALGLRVAEALQPSSFRVLGHAAMSCASLEQGLALMLRYQRLVSEAGTLAIHSQTASAVTIAYTEQPMRLGLLPQQIEAIVGGILSQARWLACRPLVPEVVTFQHPLQGSAADYQAFFGCEVQFDAPSTLLSFARADLQLPLPQADAELCRVHCELAERQLDSLPQVGFISAYALQWLSAQASGSTRIGDLARTLGLSVRSLQRQLHQEGQSWRQVVDAARRSSLIALLQTGMALEEAAQQLGYHDASSLSRAARRWFGKTPGQWRQDHLRP